MALLATTISSYAQQADVLPQNISLSSTTVAPGGSITITFDIRNQGAGNAAATTTRLRINQSTSGTSTSDMSLGDVSTPAISAGGVASGLSKFVTIPSSLPSGTYYIWVVADNGSVLTQPNYANDYAHSGALTVNVTQQPDVIPQNISLSSTSVAPGSSLTVTFDIRNQGAGSAVATTTRLRINQSTSGTSSSDTSLGDVSTPAISGGGVASGLSKFVTIPSSLPAGTYYIWVVADNGSVLTQPNYANDYAHSGALTVVVTQQPDVLPQNISLSSSTVTSGNSLTVTFDIRNQGTGSAAATTTRLRINQSTSGTSSSDTFLGDVSTPAISAGGVASGLSKLVTIPSSLPAGTYYIWVVADNGSALTQPNYANDYAHSAPLTVNVTQQPDVLPQNITLSSTSVAPGGTLTVTFDIANQGNGSAASTTTRLRINQSTSGTSTSDTSLGDVSTPTISAGGVASGLSKLVTIPSSLPAGTYYIWVVADNGAVLTQPNYGNDYAHSGALTVNVTQQPDVLPQNISLSSTSVAPGGTVTVTFDIRNQGTGSAAATTTRLRINQSTTGTSASDTSLGDVSTPAISSGGVASGLSKLVTIPSSLATGTYYIWVVADNGAVLTQPNYANDYAHSGALTINVTQQPDVLPQNISVTSSSVAAGGTLTVTFDIRNQGTASAAATTTRLRINQSSTGTSTSDTSLGDVMTPAIPSGGVASGLSKLVTIPNSLPGGTYYIWVVADNASVLTQPNYANDYGHSAAISVANGIPVTRALGVDVYHGQGTIDWSQVGGAGKKFAFIKATDGYRSSPNLPMFTDANFATYAPAASQAGLLVGAYHFARPYLNSAKDEADHFLAVAGDYIGSGHLPPVLDIEDPSDDAPHTQTSALGKATLSQWIRDWCAEIESVKHVKPVLYMTPWFTRNLIESDLTQYALWIAYYQTSSDVNPTSLGPWGSSWLFVQYATGSAVTGIQNAPDVDAFNGDATALTALAGAGSPPQVLTPAFSPQPGSYTSPVSVSITCATPGATVRYTSDQSEPTATSPIVPSSISVSNTKTLKAKAFKAGMSDSSTVAGVYTIASVLTVAAPSFSPSPGMFNAPQYVSISCATDGATVYYTVDGSDPTTSSATYTAPIYVNATKTIKAKAIKSGMADSATRQGAYTIGATLPLMVGSLKINGDNISSVGSGRFNVSGHVTINDALTVNGSVVCDIPNTQVTVSGLLGFQVGAVSSEFSTILNTSGLTFNGSGAVVGGTPGTLSSSFKLGGLSLALSDFAIINGGVQFSSSVQIPNVSSHPDDPTPLGVTLPVMRLDTQSPYLHFISGLAEVHVSNVYLAKSKFGIADLDVLYELDNKRFYGGITLSLPSDQTVTGQCEIIGGRLNSVFFGWTGSVPLYTFTGGDKLSLTALSGGIDHLSDGRPLTLLAGKMDFESSSVDTAGLGLSWGAGDVEAVTVNGAAMWSSDWNMSFAGEMEIFKPSFRIAKLSGRYISGEQMIEARGLIGIKDWVSVDGTFVTSFKPDDRYFVASGRGNVSLPDVHWASKFLPSGPVLVGQAAILGRSSPVQKYLAGARVTADLPVLGKRSVSYQYDMQSDQFSDQLDYELIAIFDQANNVVKAVHKNFSPRIGSLQSYNVDITADKGSSGIIVRLKHQQGVANLNLIRPGGQIISAQNADGVNAAFVQNPDASETIALVKSAENGTWKIEFDPTALGQWSFNFLSPRDLPKVITTVPQQNVVVTPQDSVAIAFDVTNSPTAGNVNIYLDTDRVWGGGTFMAANPAGLSGTNNLVLTNKHCGVYYVGYEFDQDGQLPLTQFADQKIVISDGTVPADNLMISRAGFLVSWAQHSHGMNSDQFSATGYLNPSGFPSTASKMSLHARLNGLDLGDFLLNANGIFVSPRTNKTHFVVSVNRFNGQFSITGTSLDLREALGLSQTIEKTQLQTEIELQVTDPNVAVPKSKALLTFNCITTTTSSAGTFVANIQTNVLGAYHPLQTIATQVTTNSFAVSQTATVADFMGGAIVPSGDLTLTIGQQDIQVPFTSIVKSGLKDSVSVWSYSSRISPLANVLSFTLNNASKQITFKLTGLVQSGIPVKTSPTISTVVPITLQVPTAQGIKRFETVVELRRVSPSSTVWVR